MPVSDMKWENRGINVCRMGKHSKVSHSTIRRLGENVVLRLMECLTPSVSFDIFVDNYFTSFRLLTHLGVSNIQATRVLTLNSTHQAKKQCNFDTGCLERQQRDLHS